MGTHHVGDLRPAVRIALHLRDAGLVVLGIIEAVLVEVVRAQLDEEAEHGRGARAAVVPGVAGDKTTTVSQRARTSTRCLRQQHAPNDDRIILRVVFAFQEDVVEEHCANAAALSGMAQQDASSHVAELCDASRCAYYCLRRSVARRRARSRSRPSRAAAPPIQGAT
jgi:hypothetical protein